MCRAPLRAGRFSGVPDSDTRDVKEVIVPFEEVEVRGLIAEEVGSPRGDGLSGSGLYAVPIRLSRMLTADEAQLLVGIWDRPPRFTTMHRPGIARVSGDVFVLDGTTIDEVERYHAATLAAVVERFNVDAAEAAEHRARRAAAKEQAEAVHRQHVQDVSRRIRFQ